MKLELAQEASRWPLLVPSSAPRPGKIGLATDKTCANLYLLGYLSCEQLVHKKDLDFR